MKQMNLRAWGLLFFLSLLWGGSFFLNEIIVVELRPFTLVFGRTALATLVLYGVIYFSGEKMPVALKWWGAFAVMGLINNLIPFSLIVWGQRTIDGGLAAILNATTPLFTVVIANAFTTDERMTWNKLLGVLLGLVGVAVMIGPEALQGVRGNVLAQLAILGAACSYGFASIYGKRFSGLSPMVTAAGMLTMTAIFSLPLSFIFEQAWAVRPSMGVIFALIGLAVLSTSLAYLIFFRLLATAGATNVSLVTVLVPLSALLLGAIFLGERLTLLTAIGMLLIFAGLAAVDGRPLGLHRPRPLPAE